MGKVGKERGKNGTDTNKQENEEMKEGKYYTEKMGINRKSRNIKKEKLGRNYMNEQEKEEKQKKK
jgi:hypothetical protein